MSSATFTTDPDRRLALRTALDERAMLVVGLCAAWCDTCNEFRAAFDAVARQRDAATFVWLDIEDDVELVGDIDVETFPTLAIYRDTRLAYFGISRPQEGVVERLVDSFGVSTPSIDGPEAVVTLPMRLGRIASSGTTTDANGAKPRAAP